MSAIFSPCGTWRYRLDREFLIPGPTIGFMLHNPSKAGTSTEDPSSRRGINFSRGWGAGRLVYMNPWAGVATKPADLWRMDDPVGPDNDRHIAAALDEIRATGGFVVAAWGSVSPPAHAREAARRRLADVVEMLRAHDLRALAINKDGSPKHPLYVRATTLPAPWSPP
jgi:hypothetical protein